MAAAPIWDASTVPYRGSGRRNVLRRSNSDRMDGALQSTLHNELDVQFISGVRLVCARRAFRGTPSDKRGNNLVSSKLPPHVSIAVGSTLCIPRFC
uniref:Uncharacterized protein n=1 Tax=Aegilops tauschii TaxID=37682 RepID=M8BKQ3_AEGTA